MAGSPRPCDGEEFWFHEFVGEDKTGAWQDGLVRWSRKLGFLKRTVLQSVVELAQCDSTTPEAD